MVNLEPNQPWLYLVIYFSVLAFLTLFGIIMTLVQRRKKKKASESNNTITN